jgi:multidrug transporter EmrE-like cation transporter
MDLSVLLGINATNMTNATSTGDLAPSGASINCVLLALAGGVCNVLSINVLGYPTHLAKKKAEQLPGEQPASISPVFTVLNVLFAFASVGMFVLATGAGPIALAMPLMTGSGLLLNMLVQSLLRIKQFTKPVRVGTLVLVGAVICLVDVGPSEQKGQDVLLLLSSIESIIWIVVCVAVLIFGCYKCRALADAPMDSLSKNLAFAAVAALAGVLGASIGKLMLQGPGIGPLFYLFVFLYVCAGVLNFGAAMLAASRADLGLYMPIFSCLQLWVNCLTGLVIWQVNAAKMGSPPPTPVDAVVDPLVRLLGLEGHQFMDGVRLRLHLDSARSLRMLLVRRRPCHGPSCSIQEDEAQ